MKKYLILCVLFAVSSCDDSKILNEPLASEQKTDRTGDKNIAHSNESNSRLNKAYLTQHRAEMRSQRVSNVKYKLAFALTGKPEFSGITDIEFDLADNASALSVDLSQAKIQSLVVNEQDIKIDYNEAFFVIPKHQLKLGKNKVHVEFSRLHSTNGEGLHRFVDSTDGRGYLDSHFEPAAAHQMFASFDQPDLKATYQLTVTAPSDWQVISATRENKIVDNEQSKTWYFPETAKLSPYNFSMHAGPYKSWSDNSGKYPMRLFARQSIANKITPELWFGYTKAGLAFFDEYFAIDYPFKKYDQVIVPDFLYGAMENAAAITFAERAFVSSSEKTESQKQRLAGVIMHEMAHQWFGDLVTMKWWNGLWLNESFASFMGTLATAEATEFDYNWRSFYAGNKQSAYIADQRITTHSIEVPVATSANAFDNIDAITYSKGASTLMQLRHLLGPDKFRLGVQSYLSKYSYKNASLDDFIGSLANAADRDLTEWKNQWLYHAGVNTITSVIKCSNNRIESLTLKQTADKNYPTLREQKIQVGLFSLADGQLKVNQAIPVIYKGKETRVEQATGLVCPDLIYPNYQDWGFVKINLDKRSFDSAKQYLNNVSDPLLRSMLWQSLWDSVRDGNLPLNEYLDVATKNVGGETDYTLLRQALGNIESASNYLKLIGDQSASYRKQVQQKLETLFWQKANDDASDNSFQKRWFSAFIDNAESHESLSKLSKLLSGEIKVNRIEITQENRWAMIYQLNRYNYKGSLALIKQELAKDSGDSGQKSALAAKAIRPDLENKAKILNIIHHNPNQLPFAKIRTQIQNLYAAEQTAQVESSADQIFAILGELDREKDHAYMRSYAGSLIPATCTPASVRRLTKVIKELSELSEGTKRRLLIAHQEDERCVLIGNQMAKPAALPDAQAH